jgi:hypothetical protein
VSSSPRARTGQNRPVLSRCEGDGGLNIGRALRVHDHRGQQFVVQVEHGAFVVISRLAWQQN